MLIAILSATSSLLLALFHLVLCYSKTRPKCNERIIYPGEITKREVGLLRSNTSEVLANGERARDIIPSTQSASTDATSQRNKHTKFLTPAERETAFVQIRDKRYLSKHYTTLVTSDHTYTLLRNVPYGDYMDRSIIFICEADDKLRYTVIFGYNEHGKLNPVLKDYFWAQSLRKDSLLLRVVDVVRRLNENNIIHGSLTSECIILSSDFVSDGVRLMNCKSMKTDLKEVSFHEDIDALIDIMSSVIMHGCPETGGRAYLLEEFKTFGHMPTPRRGLYWRFFNLLDYFSKSEFKISEYTKLEKTFQDMLKYAEKF